MNKLQYALDFLKNGIAVIPLKHRSKEPESGMMGGTWEKYRNTLPDEMLVRNWLFSGWQNYGVVCGWSNLVVIDFDSHDVFLQWFTNFTQYVVADIPFIVRSARGAHVYVQLPGLVANEKRVGVDVKTHGYVVGPGCIHPSGQMYEAMNNFYLLQIDSLDAILPVDLFPRVAPTAVNPFQRTPIQVHKAHTEYDAFQMAMFGGTDLITLIKQRVQIESWFPSAHKSSVDGRWLSCLCPFHDDTNPSAWIDVKRQLFGCTTCGFKPMDAINLYARQHNLSDADAVTALAKELGVWG